MANAVLNQASGSGSVFGYELNYYKADVAIDGITQCSAGCGMCSNNSYECVGCNSGYFLMNSECIQYPSVSIPFISSFFPEKIYLNDNYSSDLDTNFYLDDIYYTSGNVATDFTAYCAN